MPHLPFLTDFDRSLELSSALRPVLLLLRLLQLPFQLRLLLLLLPLLVLLLLLSAAMTTTMPSSHLQLQRRCSSLAGCHFAALTNPRGQLHCFTRQGFGVLTP